MSGRTARMRGAVGGLALLVALVATMPAQASEPDVSVDEILGTVGQGGWYVGNVTVVWHVDVTTGPEPYSADGCGDGGVSSIKADTPPAGVTLTCTASNGHGTVSIPTPPIRKDATKPSVTSATPARSADREGWFNHPLAVGFSGTDASSGVASCTTAEYQGPDTASTAVSGTCRDVAGNVSSPASFALKYDATAPQVSGFAPDRPADFLGYFVRPVALAFGGTDDTSGILGCDSVTYSGPDSAAGQVTGSCRDVAGNSATRTLALAFDATAPALSKVSAVAGDSVAMLSWERSPDAQTVRVLRRPGPSRPVFDGAATKFEDRGLKNGTRYSYTLTAIDAAGHETTRAVSASPSAKLTAPAAGASVKAPPRLSWKRVAKARYYNVQLFRGKRKILSAWPRRTRLQLRSAWRYGGRWQRLSAGTYRWYVWPGYGERTQRRYGRTLGSRTFTMP